MLQLILGGILMKWPENVLCQAVIRSTGLTLKKTGLYILQSLPVRLLVQVAGYVQ